MRLLRFAALAAALSLTAPVPAALPVSPLGDIYASYNDCFKVATKDGLKPGVLGPLGWSRATLSKGGKQVASAPAIYGHAKRAPIILLSAEKGEGLCVVMARLESAKAFEEFKSAWGGKLPSPGADGAITFFAEGHAVMLRQTGTQKEPAMSIAVMTPTETK